MKGPNTRCDRQAITIGRRPNNQDRRGRNYRDVSDPLDKPGNDQHGKSIGCRTDQTADAHQCGNGEQHPSITKQVADHSRANATERPDEDNRRNQPESRNQAEIQISSYSRQRAGKLSDLRDAN